MAKTDSAFTKAFECGYVSDTDSNSSRLKRGNFYNADSRSKRGNFYNADSGTIFKTSTTDTPTPLPANIGKKSRCRSKRRRQNFYNADSRSKRGNFYNADSGTIFKTNTTDTPTPLPANVGKKPRCRSKQKRRNTKLKLMEKGSGERSSKPKENSFKKECQEGEYYFLKQEIMNMRSQFAQEIFQPLSSPMLEPCLLEQLDLDTLETLEKDTKKQRLREYELHVEQLELDWLILMSITKGIENSIG